MIHYIDGTALNGAKRATVKRIADLLREASQDSGCKPCIEVIEES